MKTINQAFVDWESEYLGYGYGSGEPPIIEAMQKFFSLVPGPDVESRTYDYTLIEGAVGSSTCWLLINLFCHAELIEYGCSPRFGWLTRGGYALREYVLSKTLSELILVVNDLSPECSASYCNCEEGRDELPCRNNPFLLMYSERPKE